MLRHQTLYLQMDGGATRTVEKTKERPFPGVFQFEPEEWFVDFLLAGGNLVAVFEGVRWDAGGRRVHAGNARPRHRRQARALIDARSAPQRDEANDHMPTISAIRTPRKYGHTKRASNPG